MYTSRCFFHVYLMLFVHVFVVIYLQVPSHISTSLHSFVLFIFLILSKILLNYLTLYILFICLFDNAVKMILMIMKKYMTVFTRKMMRKFMRTCALGETNGSLHV